MLKTLLQGYTASAVRSGEMLEKLSPKTESILLERFGKDSLIALATTVNNVPYVRTIDAFYENGAFYVLTHALSGKMKQIRENPVVAVSGEWFTAHGISAGSEVMKTRLWLKK